MAGENVLQSIIDLINGVEDAVTRHGFLQLNESLSRYLLERLLVTRNFLQTESVHKSKERIGESLKELHRIATEAESIVQQCCSSTWISAAIQQAENKEAFFEVSKDLHWCTGVVKIAILKALDESGDSISELENPLYVELTPTADADEENLIRSKVDQAAIEDNKALISKLNHITEQTDQARLNEDALAIAKHLKSWLTGYEISRNLPIQQGSKIGKGASGPVFRCTWQSETFAEKCFTAGEAARKSFEQEATVMRNIRHPNVVKLVARDDAKCKLVLELMTGSLTELIVQGAKRDNVQAKRNGLHNGVPFWLPVAVDILLQISKGMLFLHGQRLAHRDIKSGNILYIRREPGGYIHVKVADFGLAKVKLKSMITMTANTGTTQWTAPELFKKRDDGQIVLDEGQVPVKLEVTVKHALRADVYSFGITCSEVLTGETNPYSAPGVARTPNLPQKVVEENLRPALPEDLPPALAYLMQICWAKDPSDRPTFAYIYKFLLDFKASLLTDTPFSYEEWNSNMDTSPNPEDEDSDTDSQEPEVVGPKFSVTTWAIGAMTWLFTTKFKSLEEITDRDVRSRQITYQTLEAATMGGALNNMRLVRLSRGVEAMESKTNAQSEEVFLKRAFFLTQLEAHPNIPKIIGYSVQNDFYLVHKAYSVKVVGSLHQVMSLSADGDWRVRHHLTWEQRYNIALGVGQALAYLHELSTPIIHGNLSSRNIMLEDTYNPKLFNFYTSFMFPGPGVHSKFPTNDTRGWDAPEKDAVRGDKTAFKQDVYSFGVLLLVLVTGRNAFTANNTRMHVHIVDEAWKYFTGGRLMALEGKDVNGDSDVVFRVLKLALYCVQRDAQRRPKIAEAVKMLQGKTQIKLTTLNTLRMLSVTPVRAKDQTEPSSSALTSSRNASDVTEKVARTQFKLIGTG